MSPVPGTRVTWTNVLARPKCTPCVRSGGDQYRPMAEAGPVRGPPPGALKPGSGKATVHSPPWDSCRRAAGTMMALGHEPESGGGPFVLCLKQFMQQSDDYVVGDRPFVGDRDVGDAASIGKPAG